MVTGGKYTGGKALALQGGDKTPSTVIASVELGREGGSQEELGEYLCVVTDLTRTFANLAGTPFLVTSPGQSAGDGKS